jgi:alpha-beta hydrolase superfamily lysophospholipase
VYLITGEKDGVIGATDQVKSWLKNAGIDTRVSTPKDMGHEVALERKAAMYRAALAWLEDGSGGGSARPTNKQVASRSEAAGRNR